MRKKPDPWAANVSRHRKIQMLLSFVSPPGFSVQNEQQGKFVADYDGQFGEQFLCRAPSSLLTSQCYLYR